jgi:hypothetical protein
VIKDKDGYEIFGDPNVHTQIRNQCPNPDPKVLGPPGSGSFHHLAKIVRKTLISTLFFTSL